MRTALATAAALLLAYALFLRLAPAPAEVHTQSPWQDNLSALERYLRSSAAPPVVLVGSSMGRKLDFGADATCVVNLALTGESSLTGLAALVRSQHQPRLVLVETNVADRELNLALLDAAANPLAAMAPVLLTANKPANLAYSYLYQLKKDKSDAPAAESVWRNALDLQRGVYSRPLAAQGLARRIGQIAGYVREIERRGARVLLFELPVHPVLEETPLARQVRDAFRAALPGSEWISHEELSGPMAIRTLDGIHLESREAAAVVERLRAHYRAACAAS
jgi:hypothetical protein